MFVITSKLNSRLGLTEPLFMGFGGEVGPITPTYDGTGLWVNSAVLESMFQDMAKAIPVVDDGDLVAVAENQTRMI